MFGQVANFKGWGEEAVFLGLEKVMGRLGWGGQLSLGGMSPPPFGVTLASPHAGVRFGGETPKPWSVGERNLGELGTRWDFTSRVEVHNEGPNLRVCEVEIKFSKPVSLDFAWHAQTAKPQKRQKW